MTPCSLVGDRQHYKRTSSINIQSRGERGYLVSEERSASIFRVDSQRPSKFRNTYVKLHNRDSNGLYFPNPWKPEASQCMQYNGSCIYFQMMYILGAVFVNDVEM
jgi:hypothetical protein